MRTEYVIPLQRMVASRSSPVGGGYCCRSLDGSPQAAGEGAVKTRPSNNRSFENLTRKLHHYADKRIRLDLDHGVKVNYGKFGDLLAQVKVDFWSKGSLMDVAKNHRRLRPKVR